MAIVNFGHSQPHNPVYQTPLKANASLAEIPSKVSHQMTRLQALWSDYQNAPTHDLKRTISRNVNELQGLVSVWPYNKPNQEIQQAQDYLLACRLYLGESEAPKQKPRTVMEAINNEFRIVEAGGRGDCCIHAALYAADPSLNTRAMVHTIRGDVVTEMWTTLMDEIDNQWDKAQNLETRYLPFFAGDHDGEQERARELVNQYCNRMAQQGTFFGEPELPFLAKVLGRDIVVYDPSKLDLDKHGQLLTRDSMLRYVGGDSSEQIEILRRGLHYQALVRK